MTHIHYINYAMKIGRNIGEHLSADIIGKYIDVKKSRVKNYYLN